MKKHLFTIIFFFLSPSLVCAQDCFEFFYQRGIQAFQNDNFELAIKNFNFSKDRKSFIYNGIQKRLYYLFPYIKCENDLIKEIENQTKKLALALKVKGFMNIQFAIKKDEIYVIEVNPRVSK